MKIAILADIHSNLKALETATDIIAKEQVVREKPSSAATL